MEWLEIGGCNGVLLHLFGAVVTILILVVPQFLLVVGSMFYRSLRTV